MDELKRIEALEKEIFGDLAQDEFVSPELVAEIRND